MSLKFQLTPSTTLCSLPGARVAISGRSKKTLDEAVKTIGNGVVAVQADVANLTDVDKLYAEVSTKLGNIDVLFVNARVAKFAPLAETSESTYDEQFDINIKGAYFTIQKALPLLNDGASIILNTSVADSKGNAGASAYSATKAELGAPHAGAHPLDDQVALGDGADDGHHRPPQRSD